MFCLLAWNCLFTPILGGFWGIFPPNMVARRSNPQKALPYAETRRLSHKAWKSVQRLDLGAFPRKRTGQDSQTKKSQSGNISPIWGEGPTVPIWTKICMVGHLADLITYAKFQVEILGVTILQGSNFPFSYWFLHGPYNSAARLRCLWSS